MPTLRMPDGRLVNFPDDMPREQIRQMILKKYPDAPGHQGMIGQFVRGVGQGITSGVKDIASVLPQVPFLSGELPGLPEHAKQARRKAEGEAEKFANEPSEGISQSIGKFLGGAVPYGAIGPTGLPALAAQKVGSATAGAAVSALPFAVKTAVHAAGHKFGIPRTLTKVIADYIHNHPAVAAAAQAVKPTASNVGGKVTGGIGQLIESRGVPLAGGIRAEEREPERKPQ